MSSSKIPAPPGWKSHAYISEKVGRYNIHTHIKWNDEIQIDHQLKNIPESINEHFSEISSDEESFEKAKGTNQDALNQGGYNYNLTYRKPAPDTKHRKNRPRNIAWFNPPYSQNVKTKVGKCFLTLIDKHFPKSNPLHKILNRNSLKLSYSCMNNVKAIILNHNKAVISRSSNLPVQTINTCNCGDKGPALWTEIATSGISYTKQKSWHRTRSKLTLVFVTHHSNRITETTLAPLEMNVIEIPLS